MEWHPFGTSTTSKENSIILKPLPPYGEAVDLNYAGRSFHGQGRFSVSLQGGDPIAVSGAGGAELDDELRRIDGLQRALDYYRLACTPKYLPDGKSPDLVNSYQATMLEWGIDKLDDIRNSMPNAGGLVIAPSIEMAEYIAILEKLMVKSQQWFTTR